MSQTIERQVLLRAREIILDPKRWTKGTEARTSRGYECSPFDEVAIRFCGIGAIIRSAYETVGEERQAINLACRYQDRIEQAQRVAIDHVNDGRGGRKRVLAILDEALALCPSGK